MISLNLIPFLKKWEKINREKYKKYSQKQRYVLLKHRSYIYIYINNIIYTWLT